MMRKSVFLTLLVALFSIATAWADFEPTQGTKYALRETTTGLYLDIQTLGIGNSWEGAENISLSYQPCIIYFEAGVNPGTWKMRNANDKYVYFNNAKWEGGYVPDDWNAKIGDSAHDWILDDVSVDGKALITIAREAYKYIGAVDKGAGKPLFCNQPTPMQFSIVLYDNLYYEQVALKSPTGTYFNFTPVTVEGHETAASFQSAPSYLYMIPSGNDAYIFQSVETPEKYIGVSTTYDWLVSTEPFAWTVSGPDEEGYVALTRYTEPNKHIGHDTNTTVGTGIFSNGDENCFKWFIEKISETPTIEYTLKIIGAPQGMSIVVKYNGEEVINGETITINGEINIGNLWATDLEGYTEEFTVNGNIITLTYTTKVEGGDEGDDDDDVEPSLESVVALINRIGGENAASKFKFVLDPTLAVEGKETFVLDSEGSKVLIKGSTLSAITTGIGWYLNNVAHINIAWNSLNEATGAYVTLPSSLPLPAEAETHTSDAQYRYYLNYCTFGYSMSTWTWERWQKEIDWMALHGVNMPLQIVGLEVVWRNFLMGNGYTEEAAESFIAGPSFTPWWGMNNLEGWGGTTNNAWFARQENLAKQILARQRALGMEPVLPGFSGMMPSTKEQNGGNWCNFTRPQIISPTAENFKTLAEAYYECLKAVMGESQYYSMDPFHEGAGDNATAEAYTAIYNAMNTAKPGSQWLIQQWQWYGKKQALSLQAVPAGKLIVLDLFSDGQPEFDKYGYNGYYPQDAMFCVVPNFGGRSGLMGRLQSVVDGYFNYKGVYANLKGICTAPESIEQTPITYDLVYQLPWMGSRPDVATWVANYTVARYGKDNAVVKEAWEQLRQGPLNYNTDGIQGPVEDVWAARPNLDANPASFWGKTLSTPLDDQSGMTPGNTYIVARRQMLIDAVYKLLAQKDALALADGSIYKSNYNYDIVEFGSAVMADYAHDLLLGIKSAKEAGNTDLYEDRKKAFLQLILDMDAFKGTNLNFRLGKWTEGARAVAAEVDNTSATADWIEFDNARTLITTWGDYDQSNFGGLRDYSYRSWQGLLKDYYYPRWEHYFKNDCTYPEKDGEKSINNYFFFEWNWAHGMECLVGQTEKSTTPAASRSYSAAPVGDAVAKAKELIDNYLFHITAPDGSHVRYAYRHLNNDLEGRVSINATANDGKINLSDYFTELDIVSVTIDGGEPATDIANVPVYGNGQHVCSVTLEDGTSFDNITIVVGDDKLAAGYYHIYFKDDTENASIPLFIGYNEDDDDWVGDDHKGYKILGQGAYTTDAEGDKIFTLVPQGDDRFTISAQGKHLLAPNFNTWNHIQFSDDASAAGVYVFHQQKDLAGGFKIQGTGTNDGVGAHNDYLQVYGLDPLRPKRMIVGPNPEGTASNFLFTPVTSYTAHVPASGVLSLCLPFNVVLPEGVVAYDIVLSSLTTENLSTGDVLTVLAEAGATLQAGTPVILKANPGDYVFNIDIISGGATPLEGSVLRGNFVKETVHLSNTTKLFVLEDDQFEVITNSTDVPANSCWVEANIVSDDIELVPKYINVATGWKFRVKKTGKGLTVTECVEQGSNSVLKFEPEYYYEYYVNGVLTKSTQAWEIIAISDQLLAGNEFITEVHFPKTLTSVGTGYSNFMFEMSYWGGDNGDNDAGKNIGVPTAEKDSTTAYIEAHSFIGMPHACKYKILGTSTWRMTVQVTKSADAKHFNDYGSCLLATKENTLADDYMDGSMQLYLRTDNGIAFKLDTNGDIYVFNRGNKYGLGDAFSFTFVLENDGAGGYKAKVTYENEIVEDFEILAADHAELHDFNTIWSSLWNGINVNVKFEKLTNKGLFADCVNLKKIVVDKDNPSFMGCDHGVLYNKSQTHLVRFPEDGGHDVGEGANVRRHFSVPYTVTMVYAGAVHGVEADIVFHSNPLIMYVEDHEDHIKAKYYLSLDDDSDPNDKKTNYAVDFVSANANTYVNARYRRAPIAEGSYGTITLPFVPTNAMAKYDFYEFVGGNTEKLFFTQVNELKVNTPYLYKLKENPDEKFLMEDGLDVFDTEKSFTVEYKELYVPIENEAGCKAVATLTNNSVEVGKYSNGSYYYYSKGKYSDGVEKVLQVTKKLNYRPYRAFFVLTPEASQAAEENPAEIVLSIARKDGTVTEIDSAQVEGWDTPIYYDLMGRLVKNPTNGIYIVNGKKVLVK